MRKFAERMEKYPLYISSIVQSLLLPLRLNLVDFSAPKI